MAALDSAVDVDFSLEKVKRNKPDERKLFRLFKQLEFKSLLKGLVVEEAQHDEAIVQELSDQEIQKLGASADTLVVAGEHLDDLVLYLKGTFFKQRAGGKVVQALLADAAIKKSGHDLKKIKVGLAKEGIVCAGLYFDTLIAAHLLNPALPDYKLTDLAWTYLGTIDSAIVIDAQKAARLVVELQARLEQELQEKSLNKLFSDIEMPLVEVLAEMEIHGVSLDLPFLASLSREIEKRLSVLVSQIYALSGGQFNLNSPKQLREVLFERLALPVSKRSKTGPSTDEEVLRSLASQHALPKMLLEYRQLTKLKNTYIDALPALVDQATGKLHTSFNQTVTETGRLSSTHPNLQNIPVKTDIGRQIRKAFIAPAENLRLVSCDYSQIELRILAHLSKDAFLIDAFKHGKDIHTATAALLHGIPEQEVDTTMREMAKRVNFGIVYGLSAFGLARDLEIPVTEAQAFIDAYFLRYPGVKEYIDKQIQFAQSNGFVMTMFSRRRYLPEINNKNQSIRQMAQRQAINTPIQGSASDLIKLAMIQIHQQLKLRGLSATMILQIHDELVFEVPAQEMPELTALVKDRMENVLALDVPIRVAIKQGKNWLEMEEMK
ncbi:MAG: DNA polymerase I [Candidatus Omnitrophica bacterium]|nr:DNA polymerase I [Candidatus Omnitrophota bacterium]